MIEAVNLCVNKHKNEGIMRKILSEIRKSALFSNVTDEEILNFIQLHPCKLVNYKKNDCIITREELSRKIGVVLDGSLGIYSDSFYGGHTLIGIGDRHYLFGFIAAFYNNSHSITSLYCREPCRIAYFEIKDNLTAVDFIKTTSPQILSNIYAILTKHIKDDFDRMHLVSSSFVSTKLARYLLYLYAETGRSNVDLRMNRTELSNFLGIYRTSLSRELKHMEQQGIISYGQRTATILNLQALIDIENQSYETGV